MKTASILFFLLFNLTFAAEDLEQKQHPYFIIVSSALAGVTHGLSEGYRSLEEDHIKNGTGKPFNLRWHNISTTSTILKIGLGIAIYDYSELDFKRTIKALMWSLAVGAPTTQISYNLAIGKNPYWISPGTTSPFEKFCTIPVFSLLLAWAILLEIAW